MREKSQRRSSRHLLATALLGLTSGIEQSAARRCVRDGGCAYVSMQLRRRCCSPIASFNENCYFNLACGPPGEGSLILASDRTKYQYHKGKNKSHTKKSQKSIQAFASSRCEGNDYGEKECSRIDCCIYDEGTCIPNGNVCHEPTLSPTLAPTRAGSPAPTSSPTPSQGCQAVLAQVPVVCVHARGAGYYCTEDCNQKMLKMLAAKGLQQKCRKELFEFTHNEFCWPHDCQTTINFYCGQHMTSAIEGFVPDLKGYKKVYFSGCHICIRHYAMVLGIRGYNCWLYKKHKGLCERMHMANVPPGGEVRKQFTGHAGIARENMPVWRAMIPVESASASDSDSAAASAASAASSSAPGTVMVGTVSHTQHRISQPELSIAEEILQQHPLIPLQKSDTPMQVVTIAPTMLPLTAWQNKATPACLQCRKKSVRGCNYGKCKRTCLAAEISKCKACVSHCTILHCKSDCM